MPEVFAVGAGGAQAPGTMPWYALGGTSSLPTNAPREPKPLGAMQAARMLRPWEIPGVDAIARRKLWGIPGRPETYERLTRRERPGYIVEYVRPGGDVVSRKRKRGIRVVLKRGARGALRATVANPGLTGLVFGLSMPFLLPWRWSMAVGAAIAVGGYASPQGSWFRRFSIGAGIGATAASVYSVWSAWNNWNPWDMLPTLPSDIGSIPPPG